MRVRRNLLDVVDSVIRHIPPEVAVRQVGNRRAGLKFFAALQAALSGTVPSLTSPASVLASPCTENSASIFTAMCRFR